MKTLLSLVKKHKLISCLLLLVVLGGGFGIYKKIISTFEEVKYITAKVEKDSLISTVSGTGQVSASSQIALSAKASGDVVYVNTKTGDEVKAGTVLLSLNASDALKSLRDAESSLEVAKLSLKKLEEPADALTLMQAEHSLINAEESKEQAEESLKKAYEDGFNSVTNAFLDLPTVMTGLENLIYGKDFETYRTNIDWYLNEGVSYNYEEYNKLVKYNEDVIVAYSKARGAYNMNTSNYKASSRMSSSSTIENLIIETYETTKLIADAVKNVKNFIDLVKDCAESFSERTQLPALVDTHQSSLESYTGTTNSHLSSLLSIKSTIENSKSSLVSADRTIAEKTETLKDVEAGTDELDLMSARLSVRQKENAVLDAKENLADYSVRAPFDGLVASFTAKKGDSLSSGASVGTLITKQMIATITLNEVDVAKVKIGQKVNLSFDAIEDLNITGSVVEVDTLGTVSSGVVSYNVKIAFDIQDERVKSGMTVTAVIVISSKPDVLLVKTSAIKSQGGASYVEVMVNGVPEKRTVVIGESNDTMTEIESGLEEGEEIITQTISSSGSSAKTTSSKTTSSNSSKNFGGGGMMMPPM